MPSALAVAASEIWSRRERVVGPLRQHSCIRVFRVVVQVFPKRVHTFACFEDTTQRELVPKCPERSVAKSRRSCIELQNCVRSLLIAVGLELRRLTLEVSWRRRQDAKPKPQKMYTVPVAWAWWPAVGAQLDRRVRRRGRGL